MTPLTHAQLIVCPSCGNETPDYADCVLCGHSLEDPDAPPRDVSVDEMQEIMMEANLQEIKAKRVWVFEDPWDHAAWLDRLQRLAEIAPGNAKLHYYIGAAQTEEGHCREAIVSFTRALSLDPAMADAARRRGDCHYLLVPVLSDDVQVYYDRALADYEAALALEPDVYTYNAHAAIVASLGKLEDAIEEYDEAIALNPGYPETYFNRGYAFKRLGKVELAVADFSRYLSFERHWNEEMVVQAESHIREMTEAE